jgi:hypothetical protein
LNTYAPQESFRILVAATLADSTSRLAALEAEESARRARRRFVMGNLTEEALAERTRCVILITGPVRRSLAMIQRSSTIYSTFARNM